MQTPRYCVFPHLLGRSAHCWKKEYYSEKLSNIYQAFACRSPCTRCVWRVLLQYTTRIISNRENNKQNFGDDEIRDSNFSRVIKKFKWTSVEDISPYSNFVARRIFRKLDDRILMANSRLSLSLTTGSIRILFSPSHLFRSWIFQESKGKLSCDLYPCNSRARSHSLIYSLAHSLTHSLTYLLLLTFWRKGHASTKLPERSTPRGRWKTDGRWRSRKWDCIPNSWLLYLLQS